jgi:hypothetical protein
LALAAVQCHVVVMDYLTELLFKAAVTEATKITVVVAVDQAAVEVLQTQHNQEALVQQGKAITVVQDNANQA